MVNSALLVNVGIFFWLLLPFFALNFGKSITEFLSSRIFAIFGSHRSYFIDIDDFLKSLSRKYTKKINGTLLHLPHAIVKICDFELPLERMKEKRKRNQQILLRLYTIVGL